MSSDLEIPDLPDWDRRTWFIILAGGGILLAVIAVVWFLGDPRRTKVPPGTIGEVPSCAEFKVMYDEAKAGKRYSEMARFKYQADYYGCDTRGW